MSVVDLARRYQEDFDSIAAQLRFVFERMMANPLGALILAGGISPTAANEMQVATEKQLFKGIDGLDGVRLVDILLTESDRKTGNIHPLLRRIGWKRERNNSGTTKPHFSSEYALGGSDSGGGGSYYPYERDAAEIIASFLRQFYF